MKKIVPFTRKIIFLLIFMILPVNIFSQIFEKDIQISENMKKFIKCNVAEKTEIVKQTTDEDSFEISLAGIEFVTKFGRFVIPDRDFSALAVVSVLALPKDTSERIKTVADVDINKCLSDIFFTFSDENVRITILNKIDEFEESENASKIINTYLASITDEQKNSPVTKRAFEVIAKKGGSESFKIVYENWKDSSYPEEMKAVIENSLILLSEKNRTDTINAVSNANITEMAEYFDLVKKSEKISENFKAEIAENVLSTAIYKVEGNSEFSVSLQLDAVRIISAARWTRAAKLAVSFFDIAKDEYEKDNFTEEQFVQTVKYVTALAPGDFSKKLSDYLAEMNENTEKNIIPAESVVLAVIESLGELGDKVAFDNLLYVAYLNYPENVKSKARDSLAKLKW